MSRRASIARALSAGEDDGGPGTGGSGGGAVRPMPSRTDALSGTVKPNG